MSKSNAYINASDGLARAIGAAQGISSGLHYDTEHMTVDQQLKVTQVLATLAVAEELSAIRHLGIHPEYDNGH